MAPLSTVVLIACLIFVSEFCQLPPTKILPPPVLPEASNLAVLETVISSPSKNILPPELTSPLASIVPELFTTELLICSNAFADKITCPEPTLIALLFSINESKVPWSMS